MATTKKIYDFPFENVKQQVTSALKRNASRATVADLVGLSGLPKYQVESVLPVVVDECRGQMQVTQSGEILYQFPRGLSNQKTGPGAYWKALGRKVLSTTAKVLKALFKVWIMVMLVGYFALFVFILVAAVAISIALSFAKRGEDRDDSGGGFMGFYLAARVFEFFMLLWLYSGDPINKTQKKKKPFHKAIFEFVFGVGDDSVAHERQIRRAVVTFVRENKGSLTLEELMRLTGKNREQADALISRLLLEFEGEPQVTDSGTLYFFFPELLRTSDEAGAPASRLPEQDLIPFTRNPAKTNQWIGFLNGFNIVLGGYFLAFGASGFEAAQALGDPLSILYQLTIILASLVFGGNLAQLESIVFVGLGIVPVLYSAFFFGIPLVRRWREKLENELRRADNFRRRLITRVLNNPTEIRLDTIEPDSERNAAGKPGPEREALKEAQLRDLAGNRTLEVDGGGPVVYSIPEFVREREDLGVQRAKTDVSSFKVGKVVFDTDERLE